MGIPIPTCKILPLRSSAHSLCETLDLSASQSLCKALECFKQYAVRDMEELMTFNQLGFCLVQLLTGNKSRP
jgi:hypothetical protein